MEKNSEVSFPLKTTLFLENLKKLLIYKNQKYGNSALAPIKVFSKVDSTTSIENRLDDKLSRIKNSETPNKNDVIDLIGYLVLYSLDKDWINLDEFQD